MRNLALPIVFEADSDGYFVSCPAFQGCYSQGDTYEEAIENIKDAIRLHISISKTAWLTAKIRCFCNPQ